MYFEAHLTIETESKNKVKQLGDHHNWTYSEINGDPDLGPGTRCYLTKHYKHDTPLDSIVSDLSDMLTEINIFNIPFTKIRRKIELVMYDIRSYKNP